MIVRNPLLMSRKITDCRIPYFYNPYPVLHSDPISSSGLFSESWLPKVYLQKIRLFFRGNNPYQVLSL